MRLDPVQARVVGSLIEKQLTTPQQYPLSLNALVAACNQTSNRDPVVAYDERTVDDTLVSLKELGLLRFVHPSHGRSVTRYRQVLEEKLALTDEQLSLVGVLLLRGPQTVAELRTRTERMARFDGIATVEYELRHLSQLPEPLVARLGRQPGQKEERWGQLVAPDATPARPAAAPPSYSTGGPAPAAWAPTPPRPPDAGPADSGLAEEVAALRAEVAELRAALEDLEARLFH
jgi:hypothetical protein